MHQWRATWTRAAGSVVFMMVAAAVAHVTAATPREGFVSTVVATGLSRPTAMAFAPDGRLFVAEQDGALRVIRDGVLLPDPFLRVTVNAAGERGLLGVAFDPLFPSNSFVYIYYTATTPAIHNRVSRFTAAGDVAIPGSEVPLLDLPPLTATNHNGGALHFGPDGFLYIGVGDNAVGSNAQSLGTPFGKLLRIARDGSIPPDNPFLGQTSGINQAIWALGLRNPFTFAFDPWSGRLLINDVGQSAWEEINEGFPGANYGWPHSEGPTNNPAHVGPLYAYTHAGTGGCAIAGGAFYPVVPAQFPAAYVGDYFFADLCAGWIRQLDVTGGIVAGNFVSGIAAPVGLAVGPEGALYYLARGIGFTTGTVGRIDFAGGTHGLPFRRPPMGAVPSGRTAVPREAARLAVPRPATTSLEQYREVWRTRSAVPLHAHQSLPAGVGVEDHTVMGTPEHPASRPVLSAGPRRFLRAHVADSDSLRRTIDVTVHGDGWLRISGATLRQLIELASDLPVTDTRGSAEPTARLDGWMRAGIHAPPLQIANAPAWIDSRRFDVEAYAGTGRPHEDVREMLHTLLRERFRLVARFTRQPIDVPALVEDEQPHQDAPASATVVASQWRPVLRPIRVEADVLTIEHVEQPPSLGRHQRTHR